jgi:hypothetical protein
VNDTVDAFVVSLGLDPSNYNREIQKYRDDRKRLNEENEKYNEQSQDGQKRQVEGVRALRNETAGFILTLAGASSVSGFFKEMVTGAAETGRLAQNLGIATERVGAWEAAIKRAGGSAENAQSALRLMSSLYQQNQLGILDAGTQGDLAGLGVRKLSANPEENLMAISQASTRMDRQQFIARASRLGLDQGTINVLAEGPEKLRATLAEMEKLNVTTQEQADDARELEKAYLNLSDTLKTALRPAIFEAVTELTGFTDKLLKFAELLKGWEFRDPWEVIKETFTGMTPDGQQAAPPDMTIPWYQRVWNKFTNRTDGAPRGGGDVASGMGGAFGRGLATGSLATGSGNRSAATVERYFTSKGYSPAQAKGIAAAVVAEGGLTQRTGGGYRGRALGIGQLLGDRRAAFLRQYGSNFTFQNELDFMHAELQGGDPGGAAVRGQRTEHGTLNAMVRQFYRPAAGAQTTGDLQRGSAYLNSRGVAGASRVVSGGARTTNMGNQTTNVGTIVINTAGKNADQIAKDMRAALAKRGLTNQSNTGLQP